LLRVELVTCASGRLSEPIRQTRRCPTEVTLSYLTFVPLSFGATT
jgi:hypothetical protein